MRTPTVVRAPRPSCRPGFLRTLAVVCVAAFLALAVIEGVPQHAFGYVRHLAYCLEVGDYTRDSYTTIYGPDGSIVGGVIT